MQRYTKGCISSIVSWGLLLITYSVHYFYLKRENKKRAALVAQIENERGGTEYSGKAQDHIGVEVDSDITDKQDLRFVYRL